jgi:hypothetical protein
VAKGLQVGVGVRVDEARQQRGAAAVHPLDAISRGAVHGDDLAVADLNCALTDELLAVEHASTLDDESGHHCSCILVGIYQTVADG